MAGFIIQRLLQAGGVVLVMSVLVFAGVYAIGNPIDVLIDPAATQAMRAAIIQQYGLDLPLWQQYFRFLNAILHGDFGTSFVFRLPVLPLILSRLPATLELAVLAMLIATLVGVPLGIWAGYRPDSGSSRAIMALSVAGFSVPTFWVGLLLILVLSTLVLVATIGALVKDLHDLPSLVYVAFVLDLLLAALVVLTSGAPRRTRTRRRGTPARR